MTGKRRMSAWCLLMSINKIMLTSQNSCKNFFPLKSYRKICCEKKMRHQPDTCSHKMKTGKEPDASLWTFGWKPANPQMLACRFSYGSLQTFRCLLACRSSDGSLQTFRFLLACRPSDACLPADPMPWQASEGLQDRMGPDGTEFNSSVRQADAHCFKIDSGIVWKPNANIC